MADRLEVDMIVKATTQGFEKVSKDVGGIANAFGKNSISSQLASNNADKYRSAVKKLAENVEAGRITQDQASAAAQRYAERLGLVGKETEVTEQKTSKLTGMLKGVAIGALAGAGAAMVAFAKNSIAAASAVEEATSKFNVVFAESADEVRAAVKEFSDATGSSRFELEKWAGTIGDTLKPMGFATDAAATLSVDIVKLGTDLASFNNIPVDEALQRLQSTLIGNHQNALAFGVIINENTLKAELHRMGVDKLTGAQLEQAKVQARINLLMAGTTDAQGDAVRTADSYANKTKALNSAMEELSVAFGQLLLPSATEAAGALTEVAKQLQIVLDVANNGGQIVTDIIDGNIEQAKTTSDLVVEYKKLESELRRGGGAAALFTGTMDDLQAGQLRVKSAILDSAQSADEYVEALRELNGIGYLVGQMTEEGARAYYEREKAARALVAMERQVEAAYAYVAAATEEVTEVTEIATYTTGEWNSTVEAQQRAAQLAAMAMGNKVAAMQADEEATRAAAQAMMDWYSAALNSQDAAFVVSEKTGEMTTSIENANQTLYDMIAASGQATPEALALLGVALGVITEEAADAALKTMLFNEALKSMAERALADGELTREEIFAIRLETQQLLEDINALPPLIDLEFETNAEQKRQEIEAIMAAAQAAAGVYTIDFHVTGGGQIPGGTGVQQPGAPIATPMALGTGGSFVSVPPGYPNDSYLIAVQSGEDFMVRTPQDRASGAGMGGGVTINVDARGAGPGVHTEVRRAVEEALDAHGRYADALIRTR